MSGQAGTFLSNRTSAKNETLSGEAGPVDRPAGPVRQLNDAVLERFRQKGDPLADAVVAVLVKHGFGPSAHPDAYTRPNGVFDFIDTLLTNGLLSPSDEDTILEFGEFRYSTPDWADYARMENGAKLYLRYALPASIVIGLSGLVSSYAAAKGVKVLVFTGRLQQDISRRLFETQQMVADVLLPEGLKPGGTGRRTLLSVRLMHAGVRRLIGMRPDKWNKDWGLPINQEDMCGTLTIFSVGEVLALQKLGYEFTPQEIEDYTHLWRMAGWLLGCAPYFIPEGFEETLEVYRTVRARQCRPDSDGIQMAEALFSGIENAPRSLLPAASVRALSRFLLGAELADGLKIKPDPLWEAVWERSAPVTAAASAAVNRIPYLADNSMPKAGRRFLNAHLNKGLGGRRPVFAIPGLR